MQVLIGQLRDAAAARRACQKTNLQKIRFINVFQCDGLLADGRGQCLKAHRAAAVVFHNGGEHAAVDGVKAQTVDLELAERVDAMVVIGGRNSSNTTRLYEICAEHCARAYHVESAEEIDPSWFDECRVVGVSAGASTPDNQIDSVVEYLSEL